LANHIRRVMAVTPRIQLNELRSAIRRDYRMGNFAPPLNVLASICKRLFFVRFEGDVVTRAPAVIRWDEVLGSTETIFLKVLQEHGPVLRREEFLERCLEHGMNENTFGIFTSYSAVLSRPVPGMYSLVGATIPPGLIEEKRRATTWQGSEIIDHGWRPNG